jgi:hypothetical protein
MGSIFLAELSHADMSTLFLVLALLCFAGAAYMAYLRNALATVLLVFVGIVVLLI